jgi:hypothetical protein
MKGIIENPETGETASEAHARRKAERLASQPLKKKAPIRKVSAKRAAENPIYSERRVIFLDGKKCAVFPSLDATEVHHKKGRQGYADQWAKDHKITLYLDERWWLGVSAEGHRYIGSHPAEAEEMGWSISRLENLDQEKEIL